MSSQGKSESFVAVTERMHRHIIGDYEDMYTYTKRIEAFEWCWHKHFLGWQDIHKKEVRDELTKKMLELLEESPTAVICNFKVIVEDETDKGAPEATIRGSFLLYRKED